METGDDGKFRFAEVPARTYNLDAEGTAKGHNVTAEKESATVLGQGEPTNVKIKVHW